VNTRCVFTNALPTGPYRGAGRPEASYLIERVVDAAADATGIDAAELRRRNLIKPEKIPYTTPFGNIYDSGEFPAVFERALKAADYEGFRDRRKATKKRGKLRGIGIGCYLEISGAFPEEAARVSFPGGKSVQVSVGVRATGAQDGVWWCRRTAIGLSAGSRHTHLRRFRPRCSRFWRGGVALGHDDRRRCRARIRCGS
jgi:carbon-monoxide dehydrogenase large subunit